MWNINIEYISYFSLLRCYCRIMCSSYAVLPIECTKIPSRKRCFIIKISHDSMKPTLFLFASFCFTSHLQSFSLNLNWHNARNVIRHPLNSFASINFGKQNETNDYLRSMMGNLTLTLTNIFLVHERWDNNEKSFNKHRKFRWQMEDKESQCSALSERMKESLYIALIHSFDESLFV